MALIDTLTRTRDYYAAALEEDAINPQPNYSLDGESIDRVSWRKSLFDMIKDLDEKIIQLQPFELRTGVIS